MQSLFPSIESNFAFDMDEGYIGVDGRREISRAK
jgi:hypothetical protein